MWSIDARVPVRFGTVADAGEGDALLIEGDAPVPSAIAAARFDAAPSGHPAGCTCCAPRGPAAMALSGLFQARAKGEVAFFHRVVAVAVSADGGASITGALREDPLVSARFRME